MNKRAVTRAAAVACAIAVVVGGNAAGAAGSASTTRAPSKTSAAVQLRALRLGLAHPDAAGRAILEHLRASAQAGPSQNRGSTPLSGAAGFQLAANAKTRTLYVPIQCRNASTAATCAATASRVVDVVDTAKCNAMVISDCRVVAKTLAGSGAFDATVDEKTDTVYVANDFSNTVSVIDGATCNAGVTRGCGKPLATIKAGQTPAAIALNPRTHTLYTANFVGGSTKGSVSVINVAFCNALTTKGCTQPVKTVKDSLDPDGIDVDDATDTVYAANDGPTNNDGDTLSVINGATCNGSNGTGCGRTPPTITVGSGPFFDAVDQATDTIYTANFNDGTASVVNGATCNGTVISGCGQTPPEVTTGADVQFVAVDEPLHTVFAMNQTDDTLSEIDTRTCNGTETTDCPQRARNQQAPIPPGGYAANVFALDPQTGTAYLATQGGQPSLSLVSVSSCNATDTSGCRVEAPTIPGHEYQMTADPATDTIYVSNDFLPETDVLNGATCDPKHVGGCAAVAEIPVAGFVGDVDDTTHTLYASEVTGTNEVAVINTATCNAHDTTGCAKPPPTITIGPQPGTPAINPSTDTLYVPFGENSGKVAVVNAATCNADVTSGCKQEPAVVRVGADTEELAVSAKTDTIYAPSFTTGDTVAVINGARCNGTDHSGCGHLAATVKVGLYPFGVAVDDATQTVYVANNTNGDTPGTVSVINEATCNGSDPAGCKGAMPTIEVGRSPLVVALNTRTDTLYVGDYSSAAVSVVNGSKCNAAVTTGCRQPVPARAVGSQPFGLAVNPHNSTVYVADLLGQGAMSIFDGRP